MKALFSLGVSGPGATQVLLISDYKLQGSITSAFHQDSPMFRKHESVLSILGLPVPQLNQFVLAKVGWLKENPTCPFPELSLWLFHSWVMKVWFSEERL